jgi:pSer/pThr/pTyr-binding forkhead associated (FHA) protein
MSSDATLTLIDESGSERFIPITSRRFSIGRLPENELPINDSSLSRRHAIIENFDGTFFITDCGSQNGTAVNGAPATAPVKLGDNDLIVLGGKKELVFHLPVQPTVNNHAQINGAARYQNPEISKSVASRRTLNTAPSGLSTYLTTPVIAAGSAGLILIGAVVLLFVVRPGNTEKPTFRNREGNGPETTANSSRFSTSPDAPATTQSVPSTTGVDNTANAQDSTQSVLTGGSDDLDQVEKYANRVLSSISSDTSPSLNRKAVSDINARIMNLKGSAALADELRSLKQGGLARLAPLAKGKDVKLPLLVYAALGKMDRDGERGDPSATAERMLPTIAKLRVSFGTEVFNDSLLILAAYDQGPGGSTHPLQITLSELTKKSPESAAAIRSVWYLHDHQRISQQAFELVLRTLAAGVVAQDPRRYGVNAEPLGI